MVYSYYKLDGKTKELSIEVGKEWKKQLTNNKLLNSIFFKVDNGDGVVQENEYQMLSYLLEKADRLIKKSANNKIVDSKELSALLTKINNNEIDINSGNLKINPKDYTVESLRKRYPESKYLVKDYQGSSAKYISVYDRKTYKEVETISWLYDFNTINILAIKNDGRSESKDYSLKGYSCGQENQLAELINKDLTTKNKLKMPTAASALEEHIKLINEDNVGLILKAYREIYGEDLFDAINSKYGLNLTQDKRAMKARINAHIEKCLMKKYNYKPNFNKTTQVKNDYYQGLPYNVVFKNNIVTVKNLQNGVTKKIDLNEYLSGFDSIDQIFLKVYLQSLPGEALMDIAVENDNLRNGKNFSIKRTIIAKTRERTIAYYFGYDDSIMLNVKQKSGADFCKSLIHEIGHAIDFVSSKNEFMTDINKTFIQTYDKEIAKFKADGYKVFSDEDPSGYYYTMDPREMFACCYEYLMTGSSGFDDKILVKYFSGCIKETAKLLKQVRTMKISDRH